VLSGKNVKELSGHEATLAKEVLGSGCLILGYLHFDGEGIKNDRQEATRFFKLSASHGCKEAEQVLGWIFNTGQYG
jgi:TPR repeat protein